MEYYKPSTLVDAYSLFDKYGEDAIPVAGTSFFMGHREELFDEVGAVISLQNLGLRYIKLEDNMLKLGATTTLADIYAHDLTNQGAFSIFSETVSKLKIKEVRNVATVGGIVCIAGEVDLPTALHAMDASLVIGSAAGQRTMSISDFHLGYLMTALEPDEIVLEVQVPTPPPGTGSSFQKYERMSTDLPIVNGMCRVTLDSAGKCSDVRIVIGAGVPIPIRAINAEKLLLGKIPDENSIKTTAQAAATEVECLGDHRATAELRTLWAKCAIEDALMVATSRAKGE